MKKLAIAGLALLASACTLIVDPYFTDSSYLTGTYNVSEYSETYSNTFRYSITVSRGFDRTVYLHNFYDAGITVSGYYSGQQITLARQYAGGYEIEGVVTVTGNEFRMTYSVRDPYHAPTDFCNSVARRY